MLHLRILLDETFVGMARFKLQLLLKGTAYMYGM
jgi:hypothetical protein